MSRFNVLIIVAALVILVAVLLWAISSIAQIYTSIAVLSPSLATILVLALLFLLVALGVVAGLSVWRSLQSTRKPKTPPPTISAEKSAAAGEQLNAIQQQLSQIQDEVARQALLDRTQAIQDQLHQGSIQVVVFGVSSAGKTSLVNAIFGRIVGEVGAPMGTTSAGNTYRLRLRGLERDILMTDTPGLLEPGVSGTEREQQARQLATDADLLLFVIDNDLRQSEYRVLRSLVEIGKRLLLVFNKTDLYPPEELAILLAQIQQRVWPLITPDDIVAVAASPQPLDLDVGLEIDVEIDLEKGDRLYPDAEIVPLLQRLAEILRSEGDRLVADTILLRSQRLTDDARQLLSQQRRQQAEKIVDRFQWIGAGVIAITPLPGVDLLATAAVNAQMVVELGKVYDCHLSFAEGKELALSLAKTLVSLGVLRGAIELFTLALQANVGTFVVGRAIQGATAAYLTRIAGKSFIDYFQRDQDWGDGGIGAVVEEQFQLNRRDEFMKAFVQEAIAKVVSPLSVDQDNPKDPYPKADYQREV